MAQDFEINGKINIETGDAETKIPNVKKEIRELSQVAREGGDALGGMGSALGETGEALKLAYGASKLLKGGILELGEAILANPIFLLAGAVAAVVVAFNELSKENKELNKSVEDGNKSLEKFSDDIEEIKNKAIESAEELAVLNGTMSEFTAASNKGDRERIKSKQELTKKYSEEVDKQNEIIQKATEGFYFSDDDQEKVKEANSNLIKLRQELNEGLQSLDEKSNNEAKIAKKKEDDEEAKKEKEKHDKELRNYQEFLKKKLGIIEKNDEATILRTKKDTKEELEAQEKKLDDNSNFYKQYGKALDMSQDEINAIINENNAKKEQLEVAYQDKLKKLQDEQDKETETYYKKVAEDARKAQDELLQQKIDADEKEVKADEKTKDDSFDRLQKYVDAEIQLENDKYAKLVAMGKADEAAKQAHEDTLTSIQDKATKDRQKIMDVEFKAATDLVNGLGSLGDILSSNSAESAKIQKGIALAQIGVDTAKAISGLVAAANENPLNGPSFGAAGIAQYAAGITSILTNVAKAKQLLNTPTSTPTASSFSPATMPSTQSVSNKMFMAPQLQQIGNQANIQANTNASATFKGTSSSSQPIKAYVVSSDLTKQQNADATLSRRASFGN